MNHSPMTPILIPPAALEAGAQDICRRTDMAMIDCRVIARAAFLAMLEVWEGMSLHQQDINAQYSYFVLPLPQEASDE